MRGFTHRRLRTVGVRLEEDGYDEALEGGQVTGLQEGVPPLWSESPHWAPLWVSVAAVAHRQQAQAGQSGQTEVEELQRHSVAHHQLCQTGEGGGERAGPGQLPAVVLLVTEDHPGVAELQPVSLGEEAEDHPEVDADVDEGEPSQPGAETSQEFLHSFWAQTLQLEDGQLSQHLQLAEVLLLQAEPRTEAVLGVVAQVELLQEGGRAHHGLQQGGERRGGAERQTELSPQLPGQLALRVLHLQPPDVAPCGPAEMAVFLLEEKTGEEKVVGVVERSHGVRALREQVQLRQVDGGEAGTPG